MLRVGLAFTFHILLPQNIADAVDVAGDNHRSNVALEAIDAMIEIGHLDLSEKLASYPDVYLQLHEIMPV